MVTAVQAVGLTITAVLIAKTLESYAKEHAMMITLMLCLFITGTAAASLSPVLQRIDSMLAAGGVSSSQIVLLSKAVGISLITELGADFCHDAGESALRTAILLTGKVTILLLSLPLLDPLLRTLMEVII